MEPVRLRLGELLVDARIISREQLEEVLELQKSDGRRLGTLLVERELVNETQLTQILSQQLSVPWVSLYHVDFSKRLLNLVPSHVAKKYCLVPIYVRHVRGQGDTLYVAMDDPTNLDALRECASWSGLPTRAMIASPADIRRAVEIYYGVSVESDPARDHETVREGKDRAEGESETDASSEGAASEDTDAQGDEGASSEPEEKDEDQEPEPESAEEPVDEPEPTSEQQTSEDEGDTGGEIAEASAEASEPDEDEAPETRQDVRLRPTDAEGEKQAPPEEDESAPDPETIESLPPPAVEPLDAGTLRLEKTAHRDSIHEVAVDDDVAPIVESDTRTAPTSGSDDEISVEVGEEMTLEELLAQRKEPSRDEGREEPPYKRSKSGKMLSLTLLDGTTLALPVRPKRDKKRAMASLVGSLKQETTSGREAVRPVSEPPRELVDEHLTGDGGLSVRDILAALRAAAHGVDSTETLGRHAQWEAMMAALLSILVRKGLITEDELLEEMRKI